MTKKQIQKEKEKCRLFNREGETVVRKQLTREQELLRKELYCREMINSCLCYDTDFLNGRYVQQFIDELGEDRVKELYAEQLADFKEATVVRNCFTDGEGLSYNRIVWADDKRDTSEDIERDRTASR